MKSVFRVEIAPKLPLVPDICGQAILSEIKDFGINTVRKVDVSKVYKIDFAKEKVDKKKLKEELFFEPLWQKEAKRSRYSSNDQKIIEITLKPGVTNTELDSIICAAKDLGFKINRAQSNRKFILWGNPSPKELTLIVDKLLMNKTIEEIAGSQKFLPDKVFPKPKVEKIRLRKLKNQDLVRLSKDRLLYLSLTEMKSIQNYFAKLGREPTDCELETIAQTWSEHCFHKTFKSAVRINDTLKPSFIERIKEVTRRINHKDCLVTFSDNAGIVSLDNTSAFCAKCETHNSPSALEPYGGAMTGSGGVFRDIAGAGLGAKNIAASDIFCFAPPSLEPKDVPAGCLHPQRIMKKCVAGVRYYGNCMGIPTINGSLSFDADFRAKPVVLVGGFGLLPKKFAFKKKIIPGDLIVSLGGKTGRDGIHGATFSSGEMTKDTENRASSAVQIGNPIEEKKMFDALLVAREAGIIKNISDCGGGGYSSSIGEMGKDIGVRIDLARVPSKYEGLDPWEIWLSESQERMIVAIGPNNLTKLRNICKRYDTSLAVLGKFTGRNKLELIYGKKQVANLTMDFLFNGLPKKVLEGKYKREFSSQAGGSELKIKEKKNYNSILKKILSNLNVASKEEIVRRYDHEVQGRLALKPFLGKYLDGPQDGAVIKPIFNANISLAFGHGLSVSLAKIDPYWGAASAIDEAVRNVVALGADPTRIFLLDNFIFPYPQKNVLGDLDRAVEGICAAATVYKTPFISGKDSLSGTYKNNNVTIRVPPTVIISSVGVIPDIHKSVSSDAKRPGNYLYILGETMKELGGSIYSYEMGMPSTDIPKIDFKKNVLIYTKLYQAIKSGLISSCHDISEGGLTVALSEMCFGGNLGAKINLDNIPTTREKLIDTLLFGENGGRLVVEVEKSNSKKFGEIIKNVPCGLLGEVVDKKTFQLSYQKKIIIKEDISKLKNIWQKPFKNYF